MTYFKGLTVLEQKDEELDKIEEEMKVKKSRELNRWLDNWEQE